MFEFLSVIRWWQSQISLTNRQIIDNKYYYDYILIQTNLTIVKQNGCDVVIHRTRYCLSYGSFQLVLHHLNGLTIALVILNRYDINTAR